MGVHRHAVPQTVSAVFRLRLLCLEFARHCLANSPFQIEQSLLFW